MFYVYEFIQLNKTYKIEKKFEKMKNNLQFKFVEFCKKCKQIKLSKNAYFIIVKKLNTDFLLQHQSIHFMIWFYWNFTKIFRNFWMKFNKFDQMKNYYFDWRYNQQFQFFNVQIFREIDRRHEFFATKFKKLICKIFLFT